MRFIVLERQHQPLQEELYEAFGRVLASSAFTLGEEVSRFEAEFAEYCRVDHCVGVASGTAALGLTLQAAGIGPGDEVIVPAHTFIASAVAVTQAGAVPVFCDVDEGTGLIDPEAARAMVTSCTAAVIAVHLYGQAADIDAIRAFADPAGLFVLEDAAQAHGALLRGRRVGSLGAAAGFSFYPSKNLGALGDGGAVCTDDAVLATRVRRLRNVGQNAKGEHVELAGNERLDGLQAALLRVKLHHLDEWNAARREAADQYRRALSPHVELLVETPDSPCIYHLFPIRVQRRDEFVRALDEHGVDSGVHYYPAAHAHASWNGPAIRVGDVRCAEAWAAQELSLPMHPYILDSEIERVVEAVQMISRALGSPSA
ncbi:MAG: DegT/DnrJ/EryC1/StrS family aminotransferase [Solirubrobacteraceae bacterium]